MISMPLKPKFARKDKPVFLTQQLPINMGFGNENIIPAHSKGYITSNGFEVGMVSVYFPLYHEEEKTQFNEFSSESYLECDPYL